MLHRPLLFACKVTVFISNGQSPDTPLSVIIALIFYDEYKNSGFRSKNEMQMEYPFQKWSLVFVSIDFLPICRLVGVFAQDSGSEQAGLPTAFIARLA